MPTAEPPRRDEQGLLLVSLGPIQDFIASARRCQDLWFGSWLLSVLARKVAELHQREGSATLVFPAGLGENAGLDLQRPGVSNLILSLLPKESDGPALARRGEAVMRESLLAIADEAWNRLRDDPVASSYVNLDRAREQVSGLIEHLWVFEPCFGPDGYDEARRRAVRRLAEVKNTRPWVQPSWADSVPKSSLDGERESVILESAYGSRNQRGPHPERLRRWFGVKGKERLCGVGLLKRLGTDPTLPARPSFHSTSHVASGPLRAALARTRSGEEAAALAGALNGYVQALDGAGLPRDRFRLKEGGDPSFCELDGSLLYESRLLDNLLSNVEDFPLERGLQRQKVDPVAKALRALLRAAGQRGEPCPYYAFLLADGDSMGKAIDGLRSLSGHQALGEALNRFSAGCREIVQRHGGALIFAGGDDVLALLPLHEALACARNLAETFAKELRGAAPAGVSPTLSVGLGISHCREPISEARALAQRAERLAKAQKGKNALGLVLARRSGGDLELAGGWQPERGMALDHSLNRWVRLEVEGALSAKTAHDLEEVAAHIEGLAPEEQEARLAQVSSLCREVLSRKRRRGGEGKVHDDVLKLVNDTLTPKEGEALAARVRGASAELQVARLFARAHRDAQRDLAPPSPPDGGAP